MLSRIILPLLVIGLSACGGDGSSTTTAQSVSIAFAARAGSVPISCAAQLKGLGTGSLDGTVKDFRFYVSDLRLIGTDGSEYPVTFDSNAWQKDNLAILDFQDKEDNCGGEAKETHTTATGIITGSASIKGVKFQVGIPEKLNHVDIAKSSGPLNVASMYWSWQGGFKFMRMDVAPVGGIKRPSDPGFSATTYNFHLGSTDCTGDPEAGESVSCGRGDRPEVALPAYETGRTIVFDYAQLVKDLDLSQDVAETPGCMSGTDDTECGAFFAKLGLDLVTGQVRSDSSQTVFTVE